MVVVSCGFVSSIGDGKTPSSHSTTCVSGSSSLGEKETTAHGTPVIASAAVASSMFPSGGYQDPSPGVIFDTVSVGRVCWRNCSPAFTSSSESDPSPMIDWMAEADCAMGGAVSTTAAVLTVDSYRLLSRRPDAAVWLVRVFSSAVRNCGAEPVAACSAVPIVARKKRVLEYMVVRSSSEANIPISAWYRSGRALIVLKRRCTREAICRLRSFVVTFSAALAFLSRHFAAFAIFVVRMREFGCGVTSRHARRCCRNRGGLLRKQKACGKCDALQTVTFDL